MVFTSVVEMRGGGSGGLNPPKCARKCANFRNMKANVQILDRKTPQMFYPISPTDLRNNRPARSIMGTSVKAHKQSHNEAASVFLHLKKVPSHFLNKCHFFQTSHMQL